MLQERKVRHRGCVDPHLTALPCHLEVAHDSLAPFADMPRWFAWISLGTSSLLKFYGLYFPPSG